MYQFLKLVLLYYLDWYIIEGYAHIFEAGDWCSIINYLMSAVINFAPGVEITLFASIVVVVRLDVCVEVTPGYLSLLSPAVRRKRWISVLFE